LAPPSGLNSKLVSRDGVWLGWALLSRGAISVPVRRVQFERVLYIIAVHSTLYATLLGYSSTIQYNARYLHMQAHRFVLYVLYNVNTTVNTVYKDAFHEAESHDRRSREQASLHRSLWERAFGLLCSLGVPVLWR